MLLLLLACTGTDPATSSLITPIGGDSPDDTVGDDTSSGDSGSTDTDTGVPVTPVEEAPRIVLNEVMTANTCSFGLDGGMPDWIELYNDSPRDVTLDRVVIWDGTGSVWVGNASVTLPPEGYFVVVADGGVGGEHAPFHLSSAGDELTVLVDGQVTDRMATGLLTDDTAWARYPDGGEWGVTAGGTPGISNGDEPTVLVDPTDNVFTIDSIRQVDITLDAAAVASLTRAPQTYVQGAFGLNGVEFDPVGFRLRGSMTFQPLTGKPAFKVDMNRYADTNYCGEIKKFNIINMYYDASLVREYMAYYVMRQMGVAASRNAYDLTFVNGDYIGVEMLSEAYDDAFLDNWYGRDNTDGYMIWEESGLECETANCDNAIVNEMLNILQGSATDENLAQLEERLDLDEALSEIAGELTLGQWDGYCAPHNFRWSYDPITEKIMLLPSSLDLTFDNLGYSYGGNYYQCSGGRLLTWCLQNDTCSERYDTILLNLADNLEGGANDMEIDAVMDQIESLVEPYAADEPRGQYDYAQWRQQFDYVRNYLHTLPDEIRSQVDAH